MYYILDYSVLKTLTPSLHIQNSILILILILNNAHLHICIQFHTQHIVYMDVYLNICLFSKPNEVRIFYIYSDNQSMCLPLC